MGLQVIACSGGLSQKFSSTVAIESHLAKATVILGNADIPQGTDVPDLDPHPDHQGLRIRIVIEFHEEVNGNYLLFGNDFDKPIRDILPYGFSFAMGLFKKLVDPSVDGDVYADQPYLYGRALTSFIKLYKRDSDGKWQSLDIPSASKRQSQFLDESKRKLFTFEGKTPYFLEFATPYLAINQQQQAILLPGFTFDVGKITCDQPLRYTLKKQNGDTYLSIEFHRVDDDNNDDEPVVESQNK